MTTEGESKELDASIDKIQSPGQLAGVAAQFRQLLGSKRDQLKGQYEAGKQNRPNFGGESGATGAVRKYNPATGKLE